jgi:predicted adenine nucleotide alpha hydrolase (AANH) superfamily ATPase
MNIEYAVESDIIIRAVDKPFPQRQRLATFHSADAAYQFIEKYLEDTRTLHTYFARTNICGKEEYMEHIEQNKIVAVNIGLGQFEDMIYVAKMTD